MTKEQITPIITLLNQLRVTQDESERETIIAEIVRVAGRVAGNTAAPTTQASASIYEELLADLNDRLAETKDREHRRGICTAMMRLRHEAVKASLKDRAIINKPKENSMNKKSKLLLSVLAVTLLASLALFLPKADAYITGSPGVLPVDGTAVVSYTTSITTNGYTLLATDQLVEFPATNITVTILCSATTGKEFMFKNLSPHGSNIVSYCSQAIDGQTSWILTNQYASMHVRFDGTAWVIISSSGAGH